MEQYVRQTTPYPYKQSKLIRQAVKYINLMYVFYDALRTQHHACNVLSKNTEPQCKYEETSDKPKLRHGLQND